MKKILILIIFFILGFFATNAFGQMLHVAPPYPTSVYVQVAPPNYIIVPQQITPLSPTPLYTAPIKPNFKTPVRDGLWYGLYYNRMWRYNRLGRILGYPHAQIPQQIQE